MKTHVLMATAYGVAVMFAILNAYQKGRRDEYKIWQHQQSLPPIYIEGTINK